jgi:cytochrome P450
MDVMRDFAAPLPLLVITQMMGIPRQDRPFIRSLAEKLLFLDRGESDRIKPISEGMNGLVEYLSPLVEEKVSKPVDEGNLLSLLAVGETTGVLTRDAVVGNAITLLMAGHITTIDLICNGTLAFIQHPEQWELLKQRLLQDPSTVIRATEECLRYDGPIKSIQRIASEDVEMRGKVLRKNDRIRWFVCSANRDPEKFVDPDKFDISRWPNAHVAFGSGIHHCLGAALARLEGQEVLKALARRYNSISLEIDEVDYEPSIAHRSLKTLPVSLN